MLQTKKTIYSKYDKTGLSALPQTLFPGRIVVVTTEKWAQRAVDDLLSQPILGIDTETRPVFHRGEKHPVALLQVSSRDVCYLFRLNVIGLCAPLRQLLERETPPMVGLSLSDDIRPLLQRETFTPGTFIDLQDLVGEMGIEDRSLQKLWANFFGERLSKHSRLTNWEAHTLSPAQQEYAALDAWACIVLYEEILRLKESGDYELVTVPADE